MEEFDTQTVALALATIATVKKKNSEKLGAAIVDDRRPILD